MIKLQRKYYLKIDKMESIDLCAFLCCWLTILVSLVVISNAGRQ